MNHEQLLAEAIAIAEAIRGRRLSVGRDGVAWVGPVGYGTELSPLRRVQLGPHLFDGTLGIALFFAAAGRVTEREEYREIALQTIAPLRRKLAGLVADSERAVGLQLALGGLIGIGSFVYGLLTIGQLLDEPALGKEAHAATALITERRIEHDRQVRVQTGCAGAILALLALHAGTSVQNPAGITPLALALACARHLTATRTSCDGRPRAWALSPGKPPLAGFSYGAAGISFALLRLYSVVRQAELWASALEGLAFVRSLYVPERRSWRDFRVIFQQRYHPRRGTWKDWWASGDLDDLEPAERIGMKPAQSGGEGFLDIWCHGASGIALGRIGALAVDDGAEVRTEVGEVLGRLCSSAQDDELDPDVADDLCCGYMGIIETLLCAGQKLGDGSCRAAAHRLMDRVHQRAQLGGRYELSAARGANVFAPSLFQGIAGVGYTMLRLVAPEKLPCLLLFE
jgi:lantibiotic modifying enzyme